MVNCRPAVVNGVRRMKMSPGTVIASEKR